MLQARQLGTELLVGIHSDEAILDNKGPTVMTLKERLAYYISARPLNINIADFGITESMPLKLAAGSPNLSLTLPTLPPSPGYLIMAANTSFTVMTLPLTAAAKTAIALSKQLTASRL
jgi:hypothetical protein